MGVIWWYTVRRIDVGAYRVVKFDELFFVEKTYGCFRYTTMRPWICTCPAGDRDGRCKHGKIVTLFIAENRVDTGYFYCPATLRWELPLNHPARRITLGRRS